MSNGLRPEAACDFAVVVAIGKYSKCVGGPLSAPLRDAENLLEWIADADGGSVPMNQIHVVFRERGRRRGCGPAESPSTSRARRSTNWPRVEDIHRPFAEFERYLNSQTRRFKDPTSNKWYLGRRLYVYFAGHGVGHSEGSASLLATEARSDRWIAFPATRAVNFVHRCSSLFREIVFFMDCCRDQLRVDLGCGYPSQVGHQPVHYSKAFATHQGLRSQERDFPGLGWHGVFSRVVLLGLAGGAARPGGKVTAESLRHFVESLMWAYFDDAAVNPESIATVPDIQVRSDNNPHQPSDFHLATVQSECDCRIELSGPEAAAKVTLAHPAIGATRALRTEPWEWRVAGGVGDYELTVEPLGGTMCQLVLTVYPRPRRYSLPTDPLILLEMLNSTVCAAIEVTAIAGETVRRRRSSAPAAKNAVFAVSTGNYDVVVTPLNGPQLFFRLGIHL